MEELDVYNYAYSHGYADIEPLGRFQGGYVYRLKFPQELAEDSNNPVVFGIPPMVTLFENEVIPLSLRERYNVMLLQVQEAENIPYDEEDMQALSRTKELLRWLKKSK